MKLTSVVISLCERITQSQLQLSHYYHSAWQHWGCMPTPMVAKLKQSYESAEEIEGFSELKEAEQDKVNRAWDEGAIPEGDQGPGEAVAVEKKAPAKRAKKDDDGEKPGKKRARKAKVRRVQPIA